MHLSDNASFVAIERLDCTMVSSAVKAAKGSSSGPSAIDESIGVQGINNVWCPENSATDVNTVGSENVLNRAWTAKRFVKTECPVGETNQSAQLRSMRKKSTESWMEASLSLNDKHSRNFRLVKGPNHLYPPSVSQIHIQPFMERRRRWCRHSRQCPIRQINPKHPCPYCPPPNTSHNRVNRRVIWRK